MIIATAAQIHKEAQTRGCVPFTSDISPSINKQVIQQFCVVYLHSSLMVSQMKSTVGNPEVCMLPFLSNASLKLEMKQQRLSL